MNAFRNVYVKDYQKFPYAKLTGKDVLNYRGKIIYYKGEVPSAFSPSEGDIVFDCDCEYGQWRKVNKIF